MRDDARFGRRQALRLAAGGLAAVLGPAAPAGGGFRAAWRYRTDPGRIARALPPGLEPAAEPWVQVEIERFEPHPPDLLFPGPAATVRLLLRVRHGGRPGWLPVALYADNERALQVARERDGLPARDASIRIERSGGVSVTVERRGRELLRLRGPAGAAEGDSLAGPLYAPFFELDPDWRAGPARPGGASLRRFDPPSDSGGWRAGDAAAVRGEFPFASPADPLAEFPVVESLEWRLADGAPAPDAARSAFKIADLDAGAVAAWTPMLYERPIERGRVWTPPGWRESATALRLTDDEIVRYSSRRETILEPIDVVEIDATISQEAHEALLPPVCRSAGRPAIKLLGLRVGGGDFSAEPFDELWLFAFSITANRLAWYALSHLVGPGGDLTLGRGVFGYPSKRGEPETIVTPVDFSLAARRRGRELAFADGAFGGFATGTSLAQLPIVTLRPRADRRAADVVFQMWTYQGRRSRLDPSTFALGLPAPTGQGSFADPWHELGPARPAMVSAMESGVMQRAPAEIVGEWADFGEYCRERCDGVLPWEERPAVPPKPAMFPRAARGART